MDEYKFTLRTDMPDIDGRQIGRFDAFIPDTDKDNKPVVRKGFPRFIQIEGAVFKTSFFGGNESIFITSDILKDSTKPTPRVVAYSEATSKQFFWHRVARDKSQKMAFGGLILAVVGALIDTAFAIGKVHVFIPTGYQWSIVWLTIALFLKIAGVWLVFRKGFWDAK